MVRGPLQSHDRPHHRGLFTALTLANHCARRLGVVGFVWLLVQLDNSKPEDRQQYSHQYREAQ